ncbi:Adaptor protein complex, sigma subunit like protein [Aduncisulcus paluster]|uniref:AP complex subunit sigma n=1 Tax=Aduncisulcus paluster TaxID=2918883 RepID=A0ABQ5JWG0_9EUKA|nr:Adaptor protein complex, sigma subunit like protein [Aduncisulcus paluster]
MTKWYNSFGSVDDSKMTLSKQRAKLIREVSQRVLTRSVRLSNVVEWRGMKLIYKKFAALYFVFCCSNEDNELLMLQLIRTYVEILNDYFGTVSELDLVYNFDKAHCVLDELVCGGKIQESSKNAVLRAVKAHEAVESDRG